MSKEEIKSIIKNFLIETKGKTDIGYDDDLFNMGIVDSLFGLQIIMFVEQTFNIKIPNKNIKLENFKTIDLIADLVSDSLE